MKTFSVLCRPFSQTSRWSRLTLLEKRLAALSSVFLAVILALVIVVIVQANKCK